MSVLEILEKVVAKVEAGDFKGAKAVILNETLELTGEEEHQLFQGIVRTCKKENDKTHTAYLATLLAYFEGVREERHRQKANHPERVLLS